MKGESGEKDKSAYRSVKVERTRDNRNELKSAARHRVLLGKHLQHRRLEEGGRLAQVRAAHVDLRPQVERLVKVNVERHHVLHRARQVLNVVRVVGLGEQQRLRLQLEVERRLDVDLRAVPHRRRVAALVDAAEARAELVPLQKRRRGYIKVCSDFSSHTSDFLHILKKIYCP